VPFNNPYSEKHSHKGSFLEMNGREVFQFAVETILSSINKILKEENLEIGDINYIVPHQANSRILEYAAKKLNVPLDKFYINLDKYGNTSAASIPIALNEMNNQGLLKPGDKIIMVAFGGGLTYGGALIQWT
jgi:3-oxoacyl-[acyl-carrier-protein] synthase-3